MRKALIAVVLIVFCLTLPLLPACGKEEAGVLSARLDGSALFWDAYPNASAYLVRCTFSDGSTYAVKVSSSVNSYEIKHTTVGNYLYSVTAQTSSGETLASSDSFLYHLGKGDRDDPILVGSAEDLLSIAGSHKVTIGDRTVSAPLFYRMTTDIDLSGQKVTPIGTEEDPFRGTFDGAGHKITGLTITEAKESNRVGLFGATKNATIKNLTLEDASLSIEKKSDIAEPLLNPLSFGLLVGYSLASVIDNCHVTGNINVLPVTDISSDYNLFAGGIVGSVQSGRISGCSFRGAVSARYGSAYAGGILGEAKDGTPKFVMTNCFADAVVLAYGAARDVTSETHKGYARAGILAGSVVRPERLSSLFATGSATAQVRDGTKNPDQYKSVGVFGMTSADGNTTSAKIYGLYYPSAVERVAGNCTSLGVFANYVHPLSEEDMTRADSYPADDVAALDRAHYWRIEEGALPALKGESSLAIAPDLELEIRVRDTEEKTYEFSLPNTFASSYFELSLPRPTQYYLGYQLKDIFTGLGISYKEGTEIRIAAEGATERSFTVGSSGFTPYLLFGTYAGSAFESPAEIFGGYRLGDKTESTIYEDFSSAKRIEITVIPPKTTAE